MKKIQLLVLYSFLLGVVFSVSTAFKNTDKKEQYESLMLSKVKSKKYNFNTVNCTSCHGCANETIVKNDSLYLEKLFFFKQDSIVLVKENKTKAIKSQL